jgi:hypothetical protein
MTVAGPRVISRTSTWCVSSKRIPETSMTIVCVTLTGMRWDGLAFFGLTGEGKGRSGAERNQNAPNPATARLRCSIYTPTESHGHQPTGTGPWLRVNARIEEQAIALGGGTVS